MITDEYDKKLNVKLGKNDVLLIEGVFIFKLEFQKYYDFSILLLVNKEDQLKRALQRDLVKNKNKDALLSKYINRYIPAYKLYEEINNPLKYANLIIDNTNVEEPLIVGECYDRHT